MAVGNWRTKKTEPLRAGSISQHHSTGGRIEASLYNGRTRKTATKPNPKRRRR